LFVQVQTSSIANRNRSANLVKEYTWLQDGSRKRLPNDPELNVMLILPLLRTSAFCPTGSKRLWYFASRNLRRLGVGVLGFLLFSVVEVIAADSHRVLLLHSFGRDFSPWADFSRNFQNVLVRESTEPIDLFEASISTARFHETDEESSLAEALLDLYFKLKIDLIVTFGPHAANFIQRHRQRLFPSTPLLITAIASRRVSSAMLTPNDTVLAWSFDFPKYVENILRVLPKTNEIAVVLGNSQLERYWLTQMRREFEPFTDRVKFTWLNELSVDQMVEQVANLSPQSAIFYFLVAVDGADVTHPLDRAFAPIQNAAKSPIFGLVDYSLGRGAVGGPMIPLFDSSRQAAVVALRILKGEAPKEIKTSPIELGTPVYDWRELRRWNISEARLPTGSIIQFRDLDLWQQYRWQIFLIAAALIIQTLLITALVLERKLRRAAESEARDRLAELAYMNRRATVGEMSASIAHEINQPLAAIVASGNAGLRWLANKTPDFEETKAALTRIVADGYRAGEIIQSLREMFKKDAPEKIPLEINNVIRRVLSFLHYELENNKISVKTSLTPYLPPVPGNRTQLKQVILNIIMNAIEAMSATSDRARILRIRSELETPGNVIITIEDSGPGIAAEDVDRIFNPFVSTKTDGMGMGLSICRTIVENHGGRLTASPGTMSGSKFTLVLPTEEEVPR